MLRALALALGARRRAPAPVEFTTAAGTTLYVGTAGAIAGTRNAGETVALTWKTGGGSAGTVTYPTSTTWTCDVTATWADGVTNAEDTLVATQTRGDPAELSVVVYVPPKAAIQDGTVALSYDAARASTVTQGAGVCTAWAPDGGTGGAADVLIPGVAPIYNAADSDFGGRPSVQSTGTQWLQSTTPASAVSTAQPSTTIVVGKGPSGANTYYVDSAISANRHSIYRGVGTTINLYAGAVGGTEITSNAVGLTLFKFSGTTSAAKKRGSVGTLQSSPVVSVGAQSTKGFTLFSYSGGTQISSSKLTALLRVTGITPQDIYRLEQWYQLSAARGGCAATGWMPAVNPSVYLEAAFWAPTAPSVGVVTTSSASVPADPQTWNNNLGITGAAYEIRGNGLSSRHYAFHTSPTNYADSYVDHQVVLTPIGSQQWVRVAVANSTLWCNFDVINGVKGNENLPAGYTASVSKSGTKVTCTISVRAVASNNGRTFCELLASDVAGTPGNTVIASTEGVSVEYASGKTQWITQTRVQQIDDKSGVGADLTQAMAGNQMCFWDTVESANGLTVPLTEDGRTAYALSTNATLLAVTSGDDPAWAVCGVCRLTGSLAAPFKFKGAGSTQAVPLLFSGANVVSNRHDGTTGSTKTFTLASQSAWSSHVAWAVVVNSDRTCELWVGGVYIDTVTLDDLSSATMTQLLVGYYAGTTGRENAVANLAIFAGQVPGASAAARYAYLQPALQQMAEKYGLDA